MGFFKKLFGKKDDTTPKEDKVLHEEIVPSMVNGKSYEIPVKITEGMVERQIAKDNDDVVLDVNKVQIKSVKQVGDFVDSYMGKVCLCDTTIVVDDKEYVIQAELSEDELKNFDQYRLSRKYYTRLPNIDEVAIPVHTSVKFFVGNDNAFNCIESETLKFLGMDCLFAPISKRDFFDCFHKSKEAAKNEELLNKTATLNNQGIALEKEGKVDDAIAVYEENVKLGYRALHSYDRLIVLYHKNKDSDNEARIIRLKLDKFGEDKALRIRLDKLENNYREPISQFPSSRLKFEIAGNPIGDDYEKTKLKFGEFNFYANDKSNDDFMQNPNKKVIWNIQETFKGWADEAKAYELSGDFIKAIEIYEKMVANHYYLATAYDRLIKLYSKAKLKDVEKEVLIEAIEYFTIFSTKQKEYVLGLAKKYGELEFAMKRIETGGKITYYNGAFELYNPYNIVDKWRERLQKFDK